MRPATAGTRRISRNRRGSRLTSVLPPFQAFLDEHRAEVFRFLVGSVGRQEADDCFQETFIAALRAYGQVAEPASLRSWIFTIAHRKAIDHHRARARRPVPVPDLREAAGDPPLEVDGELWDHVHTLPARQRAAVLLRYAGDLPHRQIGEVIGCSEEAARRSVHEGLGKLREVWRNDG